MKTIYLFLILVTTFQASACPQAIRFGDPCFPVTIPNTQGLSIYADYNDTKCTQPLLYDGLCPDYAVGNCAQRGECEFERSKPVILTNK